MKRLPLALRGMAALESVGDLTLEDHDSIRLEAEERTWNAAVPAATEAEIALRDASPWTAYAAIRAMIDAAFWELG